MHCVEVELVPRLNLATPRRLLQDADLAACQRLKRPRGLLRVWVGSVVSSGLSLGGSTDSRT